MKPADSSSSIDELAFINSRVRRTNTEITHY